MTNGLVSTVRDIAYKMPLISRIFNDHRELLLKLQDANSKIDELDSKYKSIASDLAILKRHVSESRTLSAPVGSESRDNNSLHSLVADQSAQISSLREVITDLSDNLRKHGNVDVVPSDHSHSSTAPKSSHQDPVDLSNDYNQKLEQELEIFSEDTNVHDLPKIFHYWSHKYLRPMMDEIGCTGVDQFYAKYLLESAQKTSGPYEFVSIGSGNGDVEIDVAKKLIEMGLEDFTIECLEYNPSMIERGRLASKEQGLEKYITFTKADFNNWEPTKKYAGIMANHSLHHVVNLEGLFDRIRDSLLPSGYFVTGDIVGRNGHQRWPEAMEMVNHFWGELGEKYHYNHQLKRHEASFIDHDCSSEGFEGIRAQDIMQQLLLRFHFKVYVGFLNVLSPFIDRSFGHNFDTENPEDCAFIDRVHQADEDGFKSGIVKPTQIFAVMSTQPVSDPFYSRGISPESSVRVPD